MESGPSTTRLSFAGGRDHDDARTLVLRFLEGDARTDPYPLLNRIRRSGPVWLRHGVVVLSSRAHCEAALRSTDTSPVPVGVCSLSAGRLRRAVESAFSARTAAALVPVLRSIIDDRLDSVAARGRLEAVTDLAHPVPMAVLSHLLGLPPADAQWLHRRTMALSPALDPGPALAGADTSVAVAEHGRAAADLDDYLARAVERRRHTDGDDLLSRLMRGEPGGERLDEAEAASFGRSLLGSGYEATAALVSGSALALLRAPHEIDAVRHDPGHTEHLVEETLRLDPPVQLVRRRAAEDLDLCGTPVPRGTVMVLLLAAAHRDPALAASPDVFAADGGSPHLAFGAGPHHCPGAPLARLIASSVLVRLVQRVHGPRLALGTPSHRAASALRGLRALWVDADGFAARELPWPTLPTDRPSAHPRTAAFDAAGRTS
ncbi:cytochrome P450 [Streptomyces microflavus]|uniref:cytochrome P450 n=1 Tax=Streptomyces microflavus TaxID=1919 RepID=UPI0033EA4726